jgi:hypothetical protein
VLNRVSHCSYSHSFFYYVTKKAKTTLACILADKLLAKDQDDILRAVDDLIAMQLFKERNSNARDEFKETNICLNLVKVMIQNGEVIKIQCQCCQLLWALLYVEGGVHAHFAEGFLQAGAPEAIVTAMKQFETSAIMQQCGCGALRNLAGYEGSNGAEKVVDSGGIEVILAAMIDHGKESNVVKNACGCLNNVARAHPNGIDAILDLGGIDTILRIVDAYPQDEQIQKRACSCLSNLSMQSSRARILIRDKGGGMALAKVEHYFRDKNSEIAAVAVGLLMSLWE